MTTLTLQDFPLKTSRDIRAYTSYVDDLIQAASLDQCPQDELSFFCWILFESKPHATVVWQTYEKLQERGRKKSRQIQQVCWALEDERQEELKAEGKMKGRGSGWAWIGERLKPYVEMIPDASKVERG